MSFASVMVSPVCGLSFYTVRARVGTNTGIGSEGIVADGTEDQKRGYLPLLASGELTGALAVTEPEAGSEATNIQTSARREGDYYSLNGKKCFMTNAPIAGLLTVLARTDPDSKGIEACPLSLSSATPRVCRQTPLTARWGRPARRWVKCTSRIAMCRRPTSSVEKRGWVS
ncbi:acyl-CoA dehydrogenase family protein [Billgrantia diversa]|uniref:acyl-CoA dehydrogenase family protein n=1 Tax=Halomonas sp. MCCC 1A13316 TaxID=2733487 RepID=UPI0018D434FF|nr:acyl-CoA dehydrogenase family protein [Halomonas sp. MCCC 1A13316]